MSWQRHVETLAEGKEVSFRPRGHSMRPKIHGGQLVTVSPDGTPMPGVLVGTLRLGTHGEEPAVELSIVPSGEPLTSEQVLAQARAEARTGGAWLRARGQQRSRKTARRQHEALRLVRSGRKAWEQ